MDFNAKVENISSEQLDAIFGSSSTTPTADDLIVGTEDKTTNNSTEIPVLDLDAIYKEKPVEEEKTGEDKTDISEDTNKDTVVTDKTDTDTDKKNVVDEGIEDTEDQEQIKSVLKNTVDYLVSKGMWKDWDGRETLEIDADTYAELAAKQEETKVSEMFDELINSTGDYGKAIISHIKNGGNPDEIIDIFKEQKQVESFDISDETGQVSIVEKYYAEELGWNKARIDKFVNRLRAEEGDLEEEASNIQDKYKDVYKERISQIQAEETKRQADKAKKQEQYINTLTQTIDTFEGFTDKEKSLVKNSVLKFNKTLDDGTKVNDFYMKFYEIQNDPKQYVELIHFIMDKDGYKQKINQKAETKATDKTWNFVKSNNAVKKTGSQIPTKDTNKTSKIDFSGILKK